MGVQTPPPGGAGPTGQCASVFGYLYRVVSTTVGGKSQCALTYTSDFARLRALVRGTHHALPPSEDGEKGRPGLVTRAVQARERLATP